ncbi:uncharacterized protein LOC126975551 [Leptidea sinapis]|uniref:uncharacterized protein LOC126975551 n=1 Tax=Leptidea sinapis TaxID=189913 RepID=UPI0021C36CEF|nr:uncharacterized protein LOC126975551 [Leptidea sinapis]
MCTTCKPKPCRPVQKDRVRDEDLYLDSEQKESSSLVQEIKLLRTELTGFRQDMSRISLLVNEFSSRLDSIETRLSQLELNCAAVQVDDYSVQNQELTCTLNELKKNLNDSEQEKLLNDVEITGIPETGNENLSHIAITLAQKVGLVINDRDIVHTARRGPKRPVEEGGTARSRPLVVCLTRRHLRDELLHAARVRRGADTSGTAIGDHARRFYINEHLTFENRKLFHLAREQLGRNKNWRFVWTKGGRIFARRNSTSKSYQIRSEQDLKKDFV